MHHVLYRYVKIDSNINSGAIYSTDYMATYIIRSVVFRDTVDCYIRNCSYSTTTKKQVWFLQCFMFVSSWRHYSIFDYIFSSWWDGDLSNTRFMQQSCERFPLLRVQTQVVRQGCQNMHYHLSLYGRSNMNSYSALWRPCCLPWATSCEKTVFFLYI